MVDDFKNKMWTRIGKTDINKDELYELAARLNDSPDFECFAMRDIVSKTCGLAVIVPDGHFKTEEEGEEFINNCSCEIYCSIWIRESSYETEDHRFYDEIPTDDIMNSEFEGENSIHPSIQSSRKARFLLLRVYCLIMNKISTAF
jgi:hypothetical protein